MKVQQKWKVAVEWFDSLQLDGKMKKNSKLEKKAITVISHFTVFQTVVLWNPQMWSFLWFSLSHIFWLIRKPSWNPTWFWLGTVGQPLLTWPHGDSGYPSFWKREPTALADLSPPGMQGWDSFYSQLRQFLQMFHMFSKWVCVPYLWMHYLVYK